MERVAQPTDRFVADMAHALGVAAEPVRECFSLRIKMPDAGMQVEADQFANRLRSSGHSISDVPQPGQAHNGDVNVVDQIRITLAPVVWPSVFAAGQFHSVNVRVSNVGVCTLSSKTTPPLYIAYHWHGPDGEIIEGQRTHLLIDLPPGRTISLPVGITAPVRAGTYTLAIAPVLEMVRWIDESAVKTQVLVADRAPELPWTHDIHGPARSYAEDHERGIAVLSDWIDERFPARDPAILEIGGNFNPMTASLPRGRRWNLDVDAHGLMARNIVGSGPVRSIVGDGANLPFPDGSLDVIVMFATFHHFPDPIGLLRHLGEKINPDGLVCLLCEPIGHVTVQHNYPEYFRELEMGVNEQSFEVWEYAAMLAQAGLEIVDAKFDRGSAKIAAKPFRASISQQVKLS